MRFVRGSHQWGLLESNHFFEQDLAAQRDGMPVPEGETWEEAQALIPAGAVSFHHRRTLHGSGPNTSDTARRSIALHLRTERATPDVASGVSYVQHLDDERAAPVIFER